jgi:hypothetical protein
VRISLYVRTPVLLLYCVLVRTYLEELSHGEVVESVTAVEHHTLLGEGFGEVFRCLCLAYNNKQRDCILGIKKGKESRGSKGIIETKGLRWLGLAIYRLSHKHAPLLPLTCASRTRGRPPKGHLQSPHQCQVALVSQRRYHQSGSVAQVLVAISPL